MRHLRSMLAVLILAALVTPFAAGDSGGRDDGSHAVSGSPALERGNAATAEPDSVTSGTIDSTGSRVVVLYFHRTFRCDTCLTFEAYSEDALRDSFPDEFDRGTLVWRSLNLDEPENSHYADEHDLFESSLVVTTELDGDVAEWKKLTDIWGLVQDEAMFRDYVAYETRKSLEALSSHEKERALPANPLPVHRQLVPEPDGGGVDAGAQG
ncbi:MAG: nitrophenyl compound nitroreductase subunit ArsF family protein [Candidatus Eisenbacteria bacterium]